MDVPIWIYLVSIGIIISAFMAVKTGREERIAEAEEIEKEGEIYMKRMKEERERRQNVKSVQYEEMGSN